MTDFVCPDCGEVFQVVVMECPLCAHHYPPDDFTDDGCRNCHGVAA